MKDLLAKRPLQPPMHEQTFEVTFTLFWGSRGAQNRCGVKGIKVFWFVLARLA
jgi:hypothetical protein